MYRAKSLLNFMNKIFNKINYYSNGSFLDIRIKGPGTTSCIESRGFVPFYFN